MGTEEDRFRTSCESLGLRPSDRLAVAFSGGPDSVFLAVMASRYFSRDNLLLAYVNYHDSEHVDLEERIVRETASRLNLRLVVRSVYLDSKENGFEERARRIRYTWFAELVREENLKGILVAHQRNDDAETYLLQKDRGIVGYPGIRPKVTIFGIDVYRPLLKESRAGILRYLSERGIPYFDDPTNYNPDRKRDALRMGMLSSEDEIERVLKERDNLLPEFLEEIERVKNLFPFDSFSLTAYGSLASMSKRRLLLMCIDQLFPSLSQERKIGIVDRCFERLKSRGGFAEHLDEDTYMYRDYREFFFSRQTFKDASYEYVIPESGNYSFGHLSISISRPSEVGASSYPLFIRPVKADTPIGTSISFKTVGALMKKHHTPVWIKGVYPGIFDSEGRLVYVPMWDEKDESKLVIEIRKIKLSRPNGD